ncbi:hypothetical protein CPB84DRAFT_1799596 [Gymnopilus junonius]|uniref:Uncharacterized protein n=1 Tax=Gymnopilus junonius TaxID=109634 RepID=A0A9P5N7J2_GYMJU|nr:hypothetical protein CPB84DRAFT_1799596 [Gymnopilus junonius]
MAPVRPDLDLSCLFQRLVFPGLLGLDLLSECQSICWVRQGRFAQFVERSNESLRHVAIRGPGINCSEIIDSVRHCSYATSLNIAVNCIHDVFLSIFEEGPDGQLLFPHLIHLDLDGSFELHPENLQMGEEPPSALRHLSLRCRQLTDKFPVFLTEQHILDGEFNSAHLVPLFAPDESFHHTRPFTIHQLTIAQSA